MDLKKDFNIVFSGLKLGEHEFNYALNKEFFDEFNFNELNYYEFNVNVIMEKKENMLVFNFNIDGTVKTDCDRCAEDLEINLEGKSVHFMNFAEVENEMPDDDISILKTSAYEINISDLIYEYAVILIPTKRVHVNNEKCRQILDEFVSANNEEEEIEEEVDPRWAALKNLK